MRNFLKNRHHIYSSDMFNIYVHMFLLSFVRNVTSSMPEVNSSTIDRHVDVYS